MTMPLRIIYILVSHTRCKNVSGTVLPLPSVTRRRPRTPAPL